MWLWGLYFSEFFLIYEVPYKPWNTGKIDFYLQILFYICFQKTKYYCILMNYCNIISSKCLRDTLTLPFTETDWNLLNMVSVKTVFHKE